MKRVKRELIKENTKLKELLKKQTKKQVMFRIKMLILLKENPKITLNEVNNLIFVSLPTLFRWWDYYKKGGLERLLQ
jgi:hypothetical protein